MTADIMLFVWGFFGGWVAHTCWRVIDGHFQDYKRKAGR
jgi:hypothetical protein